MGVKNELSWSFFYKGKPKGAKIEPQKRSVEVQRCQNRTPNKPLLFFLGQNNVGQRQTDP